MHEQSFFFTFCLIVSLYAHKGFFLHKLLSQDKNKLDHKAACHKLYLKLLGVPE